MAAFFDRLNLIKRGRERKAAVAEQDARDFAAFGDFLSARLDERMAIKDPVARYIALADLDQVFDARLGELKNEFRRAYEEKNMGQNLSFLTGGSAVALAGTGVAFAVLGPIAIVPGVIAGLAVLGASAIGATHIVNESPDVAQRKLEAYASAAAHFRSVIRHRAGQIEDAHLQDFAASPQWERLVAINPALHTKMSDAFRAAAKQPAPEAPAPRARALPAPDGPKGFTL